MSNEEVLRRDLLDQQRSLLVIGLLGGNSFNVRIGLGDLLVLLDLRHPSGRSARDRTGCCYLRLLVQPESLELALLPRTEDQAECGDRDGHEHEHHLRHRPDDWAVNLGDDFEAQHRDDQSEETGIERRTRKGRDRSGDGGALARGGLGTGSAFRRSSRVVKTHSEGQLRVSADHWSPVRG